MNNADEGKGIKQGNPWRYGGYGMYKKAGKMKGNVGAKQRSRQRQVKRLGWGPRWEKE